MEELKKAVRQGNITEKRIQESFDKIAALKRKYLIPYQKVEYYEARKLLQCNSINRRPTS
jgi:hypothetical protein